MVKLNIKEGLLDKMKKFQIIKYGLVIIIMFICLITASCTQFKPVLRLFSKKDLPKKFSLYSQTEKKTDKWWEEFNDKELNTHINNAFAGNFSLKEAWERLKQAQALVVKSGASYYPYLSLNTEANRSRSRTDNNLITSVQTFSDYSFGLSSSYELDLWGRIRSEREAAILDAEATKEDLKSAAMTLASSVTERWLSIISQRMQKHLLEKQLETNKTYLELVELRFKKGLASALDVYQQRQAVEKVKAQIPLIEASEELQMHSLALLLGKPPKYKISITRSALPVMPEIPSTGLPADLLKARPDIRAANLRLRSADWNAAAAKADRLPAVKLIGSAAFKSQHIDLIFDNWILNLAANLTAPLFDGKLRAAEVKRQLAKAEENLWAYQRIVYTAIKEVEDALISELKQKQHVAILQKEMDVSEKALKQAVQRYCKGLSDYLPVLTQLFSLQQLERDMIQRKAELLIYRVNLYRALGGKWENSL
ncbi:RND efflux system, outer membrane lipoprotein, NodT family [Candidatus Magnetomoraceae bacterium gMMP-15]